MFLSELMLLPIVLQVSGKATYDDLARGLQEQAAINSAITGELAFGRWIWKTGRTRPGNGVPWNIQVNGLVCDRATLLRNRLYRALILTRKTCCGSATK